MGRRAEERRTLRASIRALDMVVAVVKKAEVAYCVE
jgi:hypothetical protein